MTRSRPVDGCAGDAAGRAGVACPRRAARGDGVPVPASIWNALLELRGRLEGAVRAGGGIVSSERRSRFQRRDRDHHGRGRRHRQELARAFAARGAALSLLDLDEDRRRAAGRRVARRRRARCSPAAATPRSEADVVAAWTRPRRSSGGPHVLVNNAARGSHTRPEELTLAEWNGVIAVTLTGYFLLARECGRRMLAAGSARS